jgi:hypothetical protein
MKTNRSSHHPLMFGKQSAENAGDVFGAPSLRWRETGETLHHWPDSVARGEIEHGGNGAG